MQCLYFRKIKLSWRSNGLKHEQVYKIKKKIRQTVFVQNILVLREREREREIFMEWYHLYLLLLKIEGSKGRLVAFIHGLQSFWKSGQPQRGRGLVVPDSTSGLKATSSWRAAPQCVRLKCFTWPKDRAPNWEHVGRLEVEQQKKCYLRAWTELTMLMSSYDSLP